MSYQLFAFVGYLVNTKFQFRQFIALLKAMDSKLLGKGCIGFTILYSARNRKTKYLEPIRVVFFVFIEFVHSCDL